MKTMIRRLIFLIRHRLRGIQWADEIAKIVFKIVGMTSLVIFILIFFFLLKNSIFFMSSQEAIGTLFSKEWNPTSYHVKSFGILSMLVGTLMLTFGSMIFAGIVGIFTSIFIAEYLSKSKRIFFRSCVEIFSSIPSVIIGLIGVTIICPLFVRWFHFENIFNGYLASFLLGVMALPTVISISLDILEDAPKSLYIASRGLGANKWETISKVIVPWAKPRLVTALMLGVGRVIGETMIVLMVAGNSTGFPRSYGDSFRTFTSTIAIEMGEVARGSLHYSALFTLGLILFCFTLMINYIIDKVTKRRNIV